MAALKAVPIKLLTVKGAHYLLLPVVMAAPRIAEIGDATHTERFPDRMWYTLEVNQPFMRVGCFLFTRGCRGQPQTMIAIMLCPRL